MALTEQQLSALSELIGRWTGLHFPPERHADLERGLARAAKDFGHAGLSSFANFLLTTAELTPDQVQALAWHLTIGETYFLRGRQTFEVLEREILPEFILARRNDEQQLRIWSAGCAGGEEPYSLAITVSRVLPERQDWNVTILATDINTRALQKANEGVYGSWSFRDTPSWLRPQFFHEVHNGEWEIRPEIKRSVTFSYLNLAADPYPSLATNTNAMDIIFCRNVLMYFSGDTMKRVVDRLHDALREGGYLFVAPSEASHEFFPQFERVATNGEIYYRKNGAHGHGHGHLHAHGAGHQQGSGRARRPHTPAARMTAPPVKARPAAGGPSVVAPARSSERGGPRPMPARRPAHKGAGATDHDGVKRQTAGVASGAAVAASAADAAALAASARHAANEGRLSEALTVCEQAIAIDKLSADYRYLCATILAELDRQDDAVKALNSTLYLDPRFVLAHFLYGNISRRRARQNEAESHFRTTLTLLEELSPDDVLPESEGMTAGKLAEIVKSILQLEAAS